jgi:hypothetical protein
VVANSNGKKNEKILNSNKIILKVKGKVVIILFSFS